MDKPTLLTTFRSLQKCGNTKNKFQLNKKNMSEEQNINEPQQPTFLQGAVRRRAVIIDTCDGCPFINIDDGYDERKWGKTWCDKLDRELKTVKIPEDCPLPFA